MSHFSYVHHDIRYMLFKTYCMSLYGCTLWDYDSREVQRFYTAWRKCIRRLMGLPYTTHCNLLNIICQDLPVIDQLLKRCIQFISGVIKSANVISNICLRLAMGGSRSALCHSISHTSNLYNVDRYHIGSCKVLQYNYDNVDQRVMDTANVIRELMDMLYSHHFEFFSQEEIINFINTLCVA